MHIHVSILLEATFPSRLPHDTEQSSLCYTVGPGWFYQHTEQWVHVHPEFPNRPFPTLTTTSSFSKSVSLFCKINCIKQSVLFE